MSQTTVSPTALSRPEVQSSFHTARRLLTGLLALSVATLIAAFLLRGNATEVNWVVWLRGGAVAAASLWFLALLGQAQRGNRSAYRRLTVLSIIIPVGIVLIIVAPDNGYPLWMKWEQGLVGLLVLGVAVVLSQRRVSEVFRAAH